MELYLLRHAHAGDPEAWEGPDAERPLTKKGRGQSERLGAFLRSVGFTPDAIITSPKLRAQETAELVARALDVEVRVDDRLAGPLGLDDIEALLADAGRPEKPVLVGHDPDFSEIVVMLIGGSAVPLKKGALARVDVDRSLTPGGGMLRWLVPPDLLDRR